MLLSVVVPTWNSEKLLKEFCQSWAAEGSSWSRLVVVDDGSTDGTIELLSEWAEHPNLLFMRQGNAGPGVARNFGLSAVETPLATFADVDDLVDWRGLSDLATEMRRHPSVDVLTSLLDGDVYAPSDITQRPATGFSRVQFLRTRLAVWGRIYRTSLLRRLDPLFPATRAGEDVVGTVRIASACQDFGYSRASFYQHRPSQSTLTRRPDYSLLAMESLRVVKNLQVERSLKCYALSASAKYLALRGDLAAALQCSGLAVRSLGSHTKPAAVPSS
jgi:hypothetical protein